VEGNGGVVKAQGMRAHSVGAQVVRAVVRALGTDQRTSTESVGRDS